jgi:hypothetical protein
MQLTKCQPGRFYGNDTVSSFQQKNQDGINNPANTHESAVEPPTKRLHGGLSLVGFVARPVTTLQPIFPVADWSIALPYQELGKAYIRIALLHFRSAIRFILDSSCTDRMTDQNALFQTYAAFCRTCLAKRRVTLQAFPK